MEGSSGATAIKARGRQRPQNSAFRGWVGERVGEGEEKGDIVCKPGTRDWRRAGKPASKKMGLPCYGVCWLYLLSFHHPIALF